MKFQRQIMPAVAGAAAGLAAGFFLFASQAVTPVSAQRNDGETQIAYSAKFVESITVNDIAGDDVREVYPFPNSPVFLIRTDSNIEVYERRGTDVVRLIALEMNDKFRELVFLEDGQSFIIHTKNAATVYTIEDRIIED